MAGTLLAMLLYWLFPECFAANKWIFGLFVLVLFPVSVWISSRADEIYKKHDDPRIVIDEILGYWTAVLFVPYSWPELIAAFVLFRILDTLKPWPISYFEKKVKGGFGVMMDDIVGGAEAGILVCRLTKNRSA